MTDPILRSARSFESWTQQGRSPVPVTLLTGFLGAGKTTLLNRILNGDHGLRVGVMVNDFGAINIDADLVGGVEENTISLTNGCVCCEIRDDLMASLEDLLTRESDGIDYIIVEASGVADPESIVMTFLDRRYAPAVLLDSVTCVVDAEGFLAHPDDAHLALLKLRQIGYSDLVILNKTDLVSPAVTEAVTQAINHALNRVRIIEATQCDVPLEVLLAVGRFDPTSIAGNDAHGVVSVPGNGTHGDGHPGFETFSYETEHPFDLTALKAMIRRDLSGSVYRCKGIVLTTEHPLDRVSVQTVGRRTATSVLDAWGSRVPRSRLIAIAAPGGIDAVALTDALDGCTRPVPVA